MIIRELLDFLVPVIWSLLATGIGVYFWRTRRRHGLQIAIKRLFSYRLFAPLTVVLTITILRAALVFIYPQEIGVVVSILSPGGIRPQPLRGGLHWIVPLAERVAIYPIYHQTLTMSRHFGESQMARDDSIRARTSDGQVVTIDLTLIFRVDPDAEEVVQLHIQWQDRYVLELVRPAMRSALRDMVALYTVDEVNSSKRADFIESFETRMQNRAKGSGILVEAAYIRNIGFSAVYAEAVEQKQMAQQGMTRAEHEAKQIENLSRGQAEKIKIIATGEAAAIVIEATAEAEARVLKAQAEAKALRLVGEALDHREDLLTFRYIDKLSPNIRAMLLPSGTPLMLPLPQLGTETIPTERATMETDRGRAPPTTRTSANNQTPSLPSSASEKPPP
jgi:regulator of protease activity HflC (stomatin/prohibitin superfamily)